MERATKLLKPKQARSVAVRARQPKPRKPADPNVSTLSTHYPMTRTPAEFERQRQTGANYAPVLPRKRTEQQKPRSVARRLTARFPARQTLKLIETKLLIRPSRTLLFSFHRLTENHTRMLIGLRFKKSDKSKLSEAKPTNRRRTKRENARGGGECGASERERSERRRKYPRGK